MTTGGAEQCTCWHLPDAFGGDQPVGWLALHESVLVRIATLRGQDETISGRVVTALWGGPEEARERYLLVVRDDEPMVEIAEREIVWAEPDGRADLCGLESTAARALAASIECVSVVAMPGRTPGPASAFIRLAGREFVVVDVRRGRHTCAPGEDAALGRSWPPSG